MSDALIGSIVLLAIFFAGHAGALIYFAATVATTLRHHSKRHECNEALWTKYLPTIIQLALKEGISI